MRDNFTESLLDKTSLISFSNIQSIGYDVMRKLGWKNGQGVGPLIKKHKRVLNKTKIARDQTDSIRKVEQMETNKSSLKRSSLISDNLNDVIINELPDQPPSADTHECDNTSNQKYKKDKMPHSSASEGEISDESENDFDLVATLNYPEITPTVNAQHQFINATTTSTTESVEMSIVNDRGDSYQVAPSDSQIPHYTFKNDKKGIGYSGITLDSHASRYNSNYSNVNYSLFSHDLNDPYGDKQDKLYTNNLQYKNSSRPTEWYDTEMASGSGSEGNDADDNYGWSGGGNMIKMSSFESGGALNVCLPKCGVNIPPNYTPSLQLTNFKGDEVKPHTNFSADRRGKILGKLFLNRVVIYQPILLNCAYDIY